MLQINQSINHVLTMNCQTPAVLCPPLIKPSPVFLCFWSSDLSPVPAPVSFTCLCSLLLTCSCDSSWNKVRPLTCLQSPVIWAQLVYSHCDPICQEISFCFVCVFFFVFFFFRIIIINSEKKQETVEIRSSYASSEYIQSTWNIVLHSHLPIHSAGQAAGKAAEPSDP